MSAKVVPVGMLKKYIEGREEIVVEAGQSVSQILDARGIPPDLVAVVMVNGRQESKSYLLREGDEVRLVPLVGGG